MKNASIRLEVQIQTHKNMRGKVTGYVAIFGEVTSSLCGSVVEAKADLQAKLAQIAHERNTDPVVRLDPADGHAWVAFRTAQGDWCYAHYRARADVPHRACLGSVSIGADSSRAATIDAMERHFASLHTPSVQEAK